MRVYFHHYLAIILKIKHHFSFDCTQKVRDKREELLNIMRAIDSQFWRWKTIIDIRFDKAGRTNYNQSTIIFEFQTRKYIDT